MRMFLLALAALAALIPAAAIAAPVGYALTIVTAYATADPFQNQIDNVYIQPTTGYFEVENTGSTVYTGTVATIAVSAFAGDMSFRSKVLTLAPGQAISVAIPNNSANVGGFNGPAYYARPGIEILLDGVISDGTVSETVSLQIADADIHSGVFRTDRYGLTSDSFVLQGGDPWGFDSGGNFGLSQTYGTYTFQQDVPEPAPWMLLALPLLGMLAVRRRA